MNPAVTAADMAPGNPPFAEGQPPPVAVEPPITETPIIVGSMMPGPASAGPMTDASMPVGPAAPTRPFEPALSDHPLYSVDGHIQLKVPRSGPADLPMVRFVSIICVDRDVPESELMGWEIELQMFRQRSATLPNMAIFGQTSEHPWLTNLAPQVLFGDNMQPDVVVPTNLNPKGRFAWVDILLPAEKCAYDGHLLLRRLQGHTITTKSITIINYMSHESGDTPPTRALVVDTSKFQESVLGVETVHICDLFFDGRAIYFPESYQQQLYRSVLFFGPPESPSEPAGLLLRSPDDVVRIEKRSCSIVTARMIMDPVVPFRNEQPAGYIENANTAGRPIHAATLDIMMTQRARNKIIELRNRFKRVSSRQRYQHFRPRDIFPLLLCQRDEVAALLNVSTTWLKDRIRAFGITEWPARALMVHSSELRLALLTLRHLIGKPDGIKERVGMGIPVDPGDAQTVRELQVSIRNFRRERFAVLKEYLTEEFYREFTSEVHAWCLDPNWDAQPPWEYTHSDHNMLFGFGRMSVVRNYEVKAAEGEAERGQVKKEEGAGGQPLIVHDAGLVEQMEREIAYPPLQTQMFQTQSQPYTPQTQVFPPQTESY